MKTATHTEARFNDEAAARAHLEATRWPNGPVCPHCGGVERISRLEGKSHRPGLLFCGDCRTQFSVTVGTVFEDSKVPLHKWVYAIHLMCAGKKGVSSKQLERVLGVTYKTAWFMSHRIRAAMSETPEGQLGGSGKTVEADETYWGKRKGFKAFPQGYEHKQKIFSLVERGGKVRSFHVANVTGKTLKPILKAHVDARTVINTDEHGAYSKLSRDFAGHETVTHGIREYGRRGPKGLVTTNSAEGFFSILKRGLNGIYHHVSEQHLQRYVTEFDFRYNYREALGVNDEERAAQVVKGLGGKRLTYRRINEASA
jgi:transposase-like protein